MGRVSLFITFLVLVCVSTAQNLQRADSVRDLLENGSLSTSERMEALYWLSAYSSSPEEELKLGTQLRGLALRVGNKEYEIKGLQRIGVAHRLMGNLGKALENLFEAANLASSDEAYLPLLADIYPEISTCYTQNGDSGNALLYGSKTIEILRKTDRKQDLAINLLNLGYDYYLAGQYDSAMAYYEESEPLLREIDMDIGVAYILGNRALVQWKIGDTAEAKEGLFKAIEMLEPIGDRFGMADYYNQLGNIYLEEQAYSEVRTYASRALEMAEEEGLKEQIRDASYLLFKSNQGIGQYSTAIEYQTKYYSYKDSIQNFETTQRLANLRTEFEVGQKQAEVDLLLQQKQSNQTIMVIGAVLLVIVLSLAVLAYRHSQSKIRFSKQLEEQKDALITLNNTKDKFFSIISHDLRDPVNTLSGIVSVTKYFLEDNNKEQLKEMLEKMEISVDRLVKLLDNLLHWALQQRGHFPYVPETLSLKGILTDVVEMFADTATSKSIKVEFDKDKDLTAYVDKNTTSAIFRNLLNNAIKFSPNGSTIKLELGKNQKADTAQVKIIDQGVGISKGKLSGLFDAESTVSTKGTAGESGLGLGLQLVRDFVELNKGEVRVESEESKGTAFTVDLPLRG